jgi:hypothetical protein
VGLLRHKKSPHKYLHAFDQSIPHFITRDLYAAV